MRNGERAEKFGVRHGEPRVGTVRLCTSNVPPLRSPPRGGDR
jgi:hypothetical protein